jgi:Capsular polysaccharide synthesis protein
MKRNSLTTILLLLFLVGIVWLSYCCREGFMDSPAIPNIWWTYWNSDEIPEVVKRCIASWRRYYPEMDFRIVTPGTLSKYTSLQPKSISWNDMPARESDIVRATLLQQYGGYWCDASIYITERVNFPMTPDTEFVGYYIGGPTTKDETPVLENWFFGTIPQAPFMTKWKDTFMSIGTYGSVEGFLDGMRKKGVDFQKIGVPSYLAMHVAAQFVMQKEYGADAVKKHLVLLKAEDGPFKYINEHGWRSREALEDLCKGNHRTPMIKFTGKERNILISDKHLADCILPP